MQPTRCLLGNNLLYAWSFLKIFRLDHPHRNSGGKLPNSFHKNSLASIILKQFFERFPFSDCLPRNNCRWKQIDIRVWVYAKWTSVDRIISVLLTSKELVLLEQSQVKHQRITLIHFEKLPCISGNETIKSATLLLAKSKSYMKHHSHRHWVDTTTTTIFMIPQNLRNS